MTQSLHPFSTPIYQSAAFASDTKEDFALAATQARPKSFYTRYGNPTVAALEARIADLEGAEAALATGSGMGAICAVVLSLVGQGQHIVAQRALYGGTAALLQQLAARFGVEVTLVEQTSAAQILAALRPDSRLLILETPSNPRLDLTDLASVAEAARARGVLTVVDSTLATPVNQTPIALGVDLVVHSATKYLAGHGDVSAGVVAGRSGLIDEVWRSAVLLGATLDPHAAWLVLRGLDTLRLRMAQHNASALEVARWLEGQPRVGRVYYPGLASHPQHDLSRRQMPGGFGGVLAFETLGGAQAAEAIISAMALARRSASFGAPRTLVVRPASMWVGMTGEARLAEGGVSPGLVRLGVGLEPSDHIVADLASALNTAQAAAGS